MTSSAIYRSSRPEEFSKKGVVKNFTKFTGEHQCWSQSAQVFSCEFCKIFNNTFFTEHLRTTASIYIKNITKKTVENHENPRKTFP